MSRRAYKPLSPERQARKNANLLAKRRLAGVKPKIIRTPEENRAAARERTATYRLRNKEKLLERRILQREDRLEKNRARYKNNKTPVLEAAKRWKQRNPDRLRIHCQNYRAKKRTSGGVLSVDIAQRLMSLQRGKCAGCRIDISKGFHLDHIVSVASGGEHNDANIQLLCPPCNMSKQAQHPVDFMQRMGYLL